MQAGGYRTGLSKAVLFGSGRGIVRNGLIAEYRFNEGAGTTLYDKSGRGNNGTLGAAAACPTWDAVGLSFDGGDYVDLPTSSVISGTGLFTYEVVAYFDNLAASRVLLGQYVDNQNNLAFYITTSGKVGFYANTANTYMGNYQSPASSVAATAWYHIVFQRIKNGAGDTTCAACYVSNTSKALTETNAFANNSIQAYAADPYIGRSNTLYHIGDIAYFNVYNRVLSVTEIGKNYSYLKNMLASRGIAVT